MIMAEEEVVHRIMALEILAELVQGFIGPFESIGDGLFRPGTVAPAGSPPEGYPGVKGRKKNLGPALAEHAFDKLVPMVSRAQSVPVSHTEALPPYLRHIRLLKLHHAQLFKIVERPEVVVSLEEVHLHARIYQVCDGSQHPDRALGHHIAVLIPEIENVSQQIQGLCTGRVNLFEKADKVPLPLRRIPHLKTQVDVGSKVCELWPS